MKYKLIKNTVANYGIGIWTIILSLLLAALIINGFGPAKGLGVEEYGVYLLVAALTGYFGLLDLGIGHSLVKFIAEYHAKGDKEKINEVVSTAFFIFLRIGVVGAMALFILGSFFLGFFNFANSDQLLKARLLLYILAIAFTTSFSMAVFRDILRGLQKFVLLAYISFAVSLVNIAVTVWVLIMGLGIVELILYTISIGFITPITMSWFVKKELPYLEIKRSYLNKNMTKSLFSFSLLLLLLFMFNQIVFYTDNLVVGWWFVGTSMVTFYAMAHRVYSLPGKGISFTLQAMMPAATELNAKEKKWALQALLIRVSKYSLALLFILGLPTLFMSKQILIYWLGEEFGVYFMVTNILIISIFFDYFNYVSSQIMIGMNRIKFLVACYGVVALLNLVLSIILVQSMGLEGVAWGTTIPFIIMALPLMWNAFRIIGINWKAYAKEVLAKTIPFAVITLGTLYMLLNIHIPRNLIEVGIYYAVSAGVYFVPFYFIAFNKEEKNDFKGIFSILMYKEDKEEV